MKTLNLLIYFSLLIFYSINSYAFLGEVRVHYGLASGEPDSYKTSYYNFQDGPAINEQQYLGVDAILMPPMLPFGFGLRHEMTGDKATEFGEAIDYSFQRTSLLVNWRLVDNFVYFGPIVSYGVNHSLDFKHVTDAETISSESATSYSYGLEGGVKIGLIRVGAEVGQLEMKFEKLSEPGQVNWDKNGSVINELDFGSLYYKVHVGIGF